MFGHEQELGHNAVVIGGGDTGREAALYLAKAGHKTTLVTRGDAKLFDDPHSKRATELDYENEPNFSCLDNAKTVAVTPTSVTLDVTLNVPKLDGDFGMMMMMAHKDGAPSVMPDSRPEGFPPRQEPFDPHAAFAEENGEQPKGPGGPPPMPQIDKSKLPHETRTLTCDSVVISGGRQALNADAIHDAAPKVVTIGDCFYPEGIRNCNNTAYAAIMQL